MNEFYLQVIPNLADENAYFKVRKFLLCACEAGDKITEDSFRLFAEYSGERIYLGTAIYPNYSVEAPIKLLKPGYMILYGESVNGNPEHIFQKVPCWVHQT